MTVQVPYAVGTAGETAEVFRRLDWAEWGRRGGALGPRDMLVTPSSTPNMSVNVAPGQVVVPGLETSYQGCYVADNRGIVNVPIAPAPAAGYTRQDLIGIRVNDAVYSGAENSVELELLQGTPGTPGFAPTPTGTFFVLAAIFVSSSTAAITAGNITDQRTSGGYAAGLAGSAVLPALGSLIAPAEGVQKYQGKLVQLYDQTVTDVPANTLGGGAWTSWAVTLNDGSIPTATVNFAKYQRIGRTVVALVNMTLTGSSAGTGPITLAWPIYPAGAATNMPCGTAWWYDVSQPSNVRNKPMVAILASAGVQFVATDFAASGPVVGAGFANGDAFTCMLRYEAAA